VLLTNVWDSRVAVWVVTLIYI